MRTPAYDEVYLDGMIKKGRYLFKLIARNCMDVFGVITLYMECDYRRYMDMGNPMYLNKTPKQILGSLNISVDLNADMSEAYDEFILEWMSDMYTYMQWKYGMESKVLVKAIGPEDLYGKYSPLHETSIKNGAQKLKKIYKL
jgi:hypothetical protein